MADSKDQKQDAKPQAKPASSAKPSGVVYEVNGKKVDANGQPVRG